MVRCSILSKIFEKLSRILENPLNYSSISICININSFKTKYMLFIIVLRKILSVFHGIGIYTKGLKQHDVCSARGL